MLTPPDEEGPAQGPGPGETPPGPGHYELPRLSASDQLVLAGFAITALGMLLVWTVPVLLLGLLIFAGGATLLAFGLMSDQQRSLERWLDPVRKLGARVGLRPAPLLLVVAGFVLVLSAAVAAGVEDLAASNAHGALWACGALLVLAGLWLPPGKIQWTSRQWIPLAVFALLLAVGIALRAYRLADLPYGVNGDEGSGGITGWEYVHGERSNLLNTAWHSFPSLYFWLLSLGQRLLGHNLLSIRLISVLGGAFALAAAIWTAWRMYGPLAAAAAGLFLAGSHAHLLFSRVAINNVWDGGFFVLLLGALWVAWKENARWAFLLAGVAIGLSQYFYTTSHLLPLYGVIWLAILARMSPLQGRGQGVRAMVLVAVAVVLPLAIFYLRRPSEFLAPMASVTLAPGGSLTSYFDQLEISAMGFLFVPTGGIYQPGVPLLLPVSAALLLLSCVVCAGRYRETRNLLLLFGLIGPLLAGTFSVEPPNSHRLQIALPLVAVLIGAGTSLAAEMSADRWPRARRAAVGLVLGVCALAAVQEARFFFTVAMPSGAYGDRATYLARAVADSLTDEPEGTQVFLFGGPVLSFGNFPSLPYLAWRVSGHDLAWPLAGLAAAPPAPPGAVFILLPETLEAEAWIESSYPVQEKRDTRDLDGGLLFRSLVIGP